MTIPASSQRALPKLMARARQRDSVEGPGSQAGTIQHLDGTTVGPELRPPELDTLPYAGVPALNAYCHIYACKYKI